MPVEEKKDIFKELSEVSQIKIEETIVEEEDKLSEHYIHDERYSLYKVMSSSNKARKRRLSRGRSDVKQTQILEEKAGATREEIMEEISRDPFADSLDIKEFTVEEFEDYTRRLLEYYRDGKLEYFVCDLETQQLEWYHPKGDLVGFALADPVERTGYFIGTKHPDLDRTEEEVQRVYRCIEKLHRTIPVANHNIIFDICWLCEKTRLEPRDITIKSDTMYQCGLVIGRDRLNPGERMSLKHMAKRVLGLDFKWGKLIDEAFKSIRLTINRVFWNINYDLISIYACFDGIITLMLYEKMDERVKEDGMVYIHELMMDAITVFAEIERTGVAVDDELRKKLLTDYRKKMEQVRKAFDSLPMVKKYNEDHERNASIGSDDNLRELFFTPKYFCLEPIEYTDSGAASTNADVLKEISDAKSPDFRQERKTADLVLRYRSVRKLESTYLAPVKDQMKDGMFLPDYNLIGARSGRISSYFHTIPKGNDIKRIFRSRFYEEGGLIFSGDYSQLEVRVIAGISGDERLKEAYINGYDVHRYTASIVFDKPMEKVSSGERSYAKTVVFGILYGKTTYTLSQDLGISKEEAQELLDFFFKGFPKIKEWVDEQHERVKRGGYVVTPWGRRRYVPWINLPKDDWRYGKALRISQNSPIQGAASDITLSATVRMQNEVYKRNLRSNIIGTVHDSIESDIHPTELFDMIDIMQYHSEEYCNNHFDFQFFMNGVPLKFDYEIGTSWGGAVDIEGFVTDHHWKIAGQELDIKELEQQLSKTYKVELLNWEKDKADTDNIFRTIDPGDKYHLELKVS